MPIYVAKTYDREVQSVILAENYDIDQFNVQNVLYI